MDTNRTLKHVKGAAIGAAFAAVAVGIRYLTHLPDDVALYALVFAVIPIASGLGGLAGGLASIITGCVLTWYMVLDPEMSWQVDADQRLNFAGYVATSFVVLVTTEYYRMKELKAERARTKQAHEMLEQQRLLSRELNHRVKNIIALVQSVANQTFKHDELALDKYASRLKTLADAQALLVEGFSRPIADVARVVDTAIKPFNSGDNFVVNGPPLLKLRDQEALMLSLALHELATNAEKYGSLSMPFGRVKISWREVDNQLKLDWEEQGGPQAVGPTRTGFGTKLLSQTVMKASLQYLPEGFRCTISQRLAPVQRA